MPQWLEIISLISILVATICSLVILIDILTAHRQKMMVMNIVWQATALYAGPLGLYVYYKIVRLSTQRKARNAKQQGK